MKASGAAIEAVGRLGGDIFPGAGVGVVDFGHWDGGIGPECRCARANYLFRLMDRYGSVGNQVAR